ncbi:hypothetical protein [Micromonospora sp. RP3T]|uniref:hypothetical protein n=1 Tax=Micromonospora sp. RP3T TaxID=2135446 RepID=UPI0011B208AC|nr:hypothetical protein [Micromonospora sp. RP3T]
MFFHRHRTSLLLGSIAASLLAMVLSGLAIFVKFRPVAGTEKPKVTDWVQAWAGGASALFTGAAFAAAAVALLVERKRRREDIERLEKQRAEDVARLEADQADRDVAQARLVMTTANFDERTMQIVSMEVTNHSQYTILDVQLWLGFPSEALKPDKNRWMHVIQALPPGKTFQLVDPPQIFRAGPIGSDHFVPWVEFVDARGLRWRRFNIMRPIRLFDGAYDISSK